MLNTRTLHHVSLPVSDIDKAKDFYGRLLGLQEDGSRPDFDFKGAWYRVGDRTVHPILANPDEHPTFRLGKAIDSRDAHFPIRVASFSRGSCGSNHDRTSRTRTRASARGPLRVTMAKR